MRVFWAIVTILCPVCATESREDCDSRSSHWDNETYAALNKGCEPLTYDEQFCIVDSDKWECMRERARMHDISSCGCYKDDPNVYKCLYLEVCAFADPYFKCSTDYLCSVDKNDDITCTAPNLPSYTNHCLRGLIHCSARKQCDIINLAHDFTEVYQEYCQKDLTEILGTNVTIYYIDQEHHNNMNSEFANITVLILAEGDEDNPCKQERVNFFQPVSVVEDWKIVVPVLSVIIPVVLLAFGGWKFFQFREQENKKIDEPLDSVFNRLIVHFTPETSGSNEGTSADDTEISDPILPESIAPPIEKEVDEDVPASPVKNVAENHQSECSNCLLPLSLESSDNERLDSFNNSSCPCQRLVQPSISSAGSASNNYLSKHSSELLEGSSNTPSRPLTPTMSHLNNQKANLQEHCTCQIFQFSTCSNTDGITHCAKQTDA